MFCEVEGCSAPGQRHHIIYRSQGGLDIEINYKYLCINHHTYGKGAIHNNRKFDHELKRELQKTLFQMFLAEESYSLREIADKLGTKEKNLQRRFKAVRQQGGKYKREDIVRSLMGDRLY